MQAEGRRDAIREILAQRPAVKNQGELLRRLRTRGIRASQATLSRDMALLGVRRAVGADGPRYLVETGGTLPLDPVRRLVDGIDTNGALVVVRTKSSAAGTVARALDEANFTEVMGTLAGDDTVFVAPRRPQDGRRVAVKLRALFGLA